jgi:hypothetical protein
MWIQDKQLLWYMYYGIIVSEEDPNVQISSYTSVWVQGSAFNDSKR